jgi:hypothetical protein
MSRYDFLSLPHEAAYRALYERIYCDRENPIFTHDGILVKFFPDQFGHAFFESVRSKDDTFSLVRAERILWIKDTLQDPDSLLLAGYIKERNCYDHSRRVALVMHDYVVVIHLRDSKNAKFVTAFRAENSVAKILESPIWRFPV